MRHEPYSAEVRRRFANTAHAGTLADGLAVLETAQGVRLELSARLKRGRLEALRFRAWGCPHLIAAAEAFCEAYEGADVRELEDFSGAPISRKLDVPVEKAGRILVLEDAVRSLGKTLNTPDRAGT